MIKKKTIVDWFQINNCKIAKFLILHNAKITFHAKKINNRKTRLRNFKLFIFKSIR